MTCSMGSLFHFYMLLLTNDMAVQLLGMKSNGAHLGLNSLEKSANKKKYAAIYDSLVCVQLCTNL